MASLGPPNLALSIARAIALVLEVYAAIGIVFALLFVTRGVGRVDHEARGGSVGFRLLVFPASAALWPLLLVRWFRGGEPPSERNAHRERAGEGMK